MRSMPVGSSSTEIVAVLGDERDARIRPELRHSGIGQSHSEAVQRVLVLHQDIPAERVGVRHRGRAVRARFQHDDVLIVSRSGGAFRR